jgi:predicted nucleotidyltransferase
LIGEELTSKTELRSRIAKEAAVLLYFGSEKEYKPAKVQAAKALRANFIPTNLEVAIELDKIADENEGFARTERLIRMRKEALRIMKLLSSYRPLLIGSVWRGTIRKGSDIDVEVYHDSPEETFDLVKRDLEAPRAEWVTVTKKGKPQTSFHIYCTTGIGEKAEIVVRSLEEAGIKRKCEIFGDDLKGLNQRELEQVLKKNPAQRFLPP